MTPRQAIKLQRRGMTAGGMTYSPPPRPPAKRRVSAVPPAGLLAPAPPPYARLLAYFECLAESEARLPTNSAEIAEATGMSPAMAGQYRRQLETLGRIVCKRGKGGIITAITLTKCGRTIRA